MSPDAPKLIWDAREAGAKARRFVQGKSFEDYMADELLRSAVERQLEIVGEALGQLRKADPGTAALVPHLAQAVALRNVLIHGYATVDDRLVWGVADAHLPPLLDGLAALLPEG